MKTILIIIASCVVVFTSMNLLFLLGIADFGIGEKPCKCDEDKEEDKNFSKPLLNSLIKALETYNIKHNTKGLAKEVIEENPEVTDLEQLINLTLKKIREKFRQKLVE